MEIYDLIVIGGGQSALACGYFLRRSGLKYLIVDDQPQSGGAWRHDWDSLTLFSPAEQSSLPGWLMPKSEGEFPTKQNVVDYLDQYEKRYSLCISRGVRVSEVTKDGDLFNLTTNQGIYLSRAIISATGTFGKPFIPAIPGRNLFEGMQLHSSEYKRPDAFKDKMVLIAGAGNSGVQILSEVSKVAATVSATMEIPTFLPDDVDGRLLFNVASAKYHAMKEGREFIPSQYNTGSVVMVPTVKEARLRGALKARKMFETMY